jgi:drug/metabolite transporter (DMT)-like permease
VTHTTAALLVLASAFLHAFWNAMLKREGDPQIKTVALLFFVTLFSWLAVLIRVPPWFPTSGAMTYALASGVCEAGYFITLALALAGAPLGKVYPISRGGALLWAWPVSVLWLGEHPTAIRIAGAILVGAGLLLAGSRSPLPATGRGLVWAAASAAFIAGYSLFYKRSLQLDADPRLLFATSVSVALPINIARLWRRRGDFARAFRPPPFSMAFAAFCSWASFWLYLLALRHTGAAAALTLRNAALVFTQGFAWWLGESPGRLQVLGALTVAAGALLISLP